MALTVTLEFSEEELDYFRSRMQFLGLNNILLLNSYMRRAETLP